MDGLATNLDCNIDIIIGLVFPQGRYYLLPVPTCPERYCCGTTMAVVDCHRRRLYCITDESIPPACDSAVRAFNKISRSYQSIPPFLAVVESPARRKTAGFGSARGAGENGSAQERAHPAVSKNNPVVEATMLKKRRV